MEEIINNLATTLEQIEDHLDSAQSIYDFEDIYRHVKDLSKQAREHVAELRQLVAESKLVEAQAEYIRKQGYLAYVVPTTGELQFYTICIRKIAAGQILGIDWAISPLDLRYSLIPGQILKEQADERIEMMKRAIAEKEERK